MPVMANRWQYLAVGLWAAPDVPPGAVAAVPAEDVAVVAPEPPWEEPAGANVYGIWSRPPLNQQAGT